MFIFIKHSFLLLPVDPLHIVCADVRVNFNVCFCGKITKQEFVDKCFHFRSLFIRKNAMPMVGYNGKSESIRNSKYLPYPLSSFTRNIA